MIRRCHAASVLLLVMLPAVAQAQQGRSGTTSSGFVVFDGKKDPQSLPEYVVWTQSFLTLEMAKREDAKAIKATLELSPAEAERAYKSGAAVRERQARNYARQEEVMAAMKADKKEWKEIYKALQGVEYDFRLFVLAERDRLLASLSPEGQVTLQAWVNDRRKAINVTVPAAEVESFKRPQDN